MSRRSNAKVLQEINLLKDRLNEGFTLDTHFDQLFTLVRDYDLTEVTLRSSEITILCVRIFHENVSQENNKLANAALQIIQTFVRKEADHE